MLFYMFFVHTLLCSLWSLRQKALRVFPFGLVVVALFYNITTNSFNKKKSRILHIRLCFMRQKNILKMQTTFYRYFVSFSILFWSTSLILHNRWSWSFRSSISVYDWQPNSYVWNSSEQFHFAEVKFSSSTKENWHLFLLDFFVVRIIFNNKISVFFLFIFDL